MCGGGDCTGERVFISDRGCGCVVRPLRDKIRGTGAGATATGLDLFDLGLFVPGKVIGERARDRETRDGGLCVTTTRPSSLPASPTLNEGGGGVNLSVKKLKERDPVSESCDLSLFGIHSGELIN